MRARVIVISLILVFALYASRNSLQSSGISEKSETAPASVKIEAPVALKAVAKATAKTRTATEVIVVIPKMEVPAVKTEDLSDKQARASVPGIVRRTFPKKPVTPPVEYPGNTWGLVGALSPMERDNILSQFHAEQGFTMIRLGDFYLIPGVSVDASHDTKGFDWNNKVAVSLGPKLVKIFNRGVVRVGTSFGHEHRTATGNSANGMMTSMDYWFGWGQPSVNPNKKSPLFPGSTWGIVGNVAPFEPGNTIGFADLTQGVNAYQRGKLSVIPFVKLQLGADSKGYDWNNKVLAGGGTKLVYSRKNGSIELALMYLAEKRMRESNKQADMLSVSGSYWFGWSPKGTKGVH